MGTSQKSDGIDIAISLAPEDLHRFLARRRVRSLPGRTSCGGVEDLAQLATTVPAHVSAAPPIDQTALHAAFDRLRAYQPLSECRHGARAAVWADRDGRLLIVREDVGRHDALDKLIGAALRSDCELAEGFCLITSCCSRYRRQRRLTVQIETKLNRSCLVHGETSYNPAVSRPHRNRRAAR